MLANYFNTKLSVLQEIYDANLQKRNVRLFIKRDDLIHKEVSGNKWRKLEYIIRDFYSSEQKQILTFGGSYSNHLLATASACCILNIPCVGIVRGDELSEKSNRILQRCYELGMKLKFVSREEYKKRYDENYLQHLKDIFPKVYIIPEGGACDKGIIGCVKLMSEIEIADHVFVAQGTSTTSCGLLLGATKQTIHAIPVIKNFDWKIEMTKVLKMTKLQQNHIDILFERLVVYQQYHFGGYAKTTQELTTFIEMCDKKYQLPLDKIYTAKAFYALMKEIQNETYNNKCIVFLHTGGTFLNE